MGHGSVDQVVTRNGSFGLVEQKVFLGPMHQKVSNDCKNGNDRMQGNEKAGEEELGHGVNVLLTDLKVYVGHGFIELSLSQAEF